MSPRSLGIFAFLTAAALTACSQSDKTESVTNIVETDMAQVSLALDYAQTPILDSIVLDIFGADTLHLVQSTKKTNFQFDLFPSNNCIFKAKLYANGTLMQTGEVETPLKAGENTQLQIQMHALIGFIYIRIPLGFGNKAGIESGLMTLKSSKETYQYQMSFEGDNGIFVSDNLALGVEYQILVELQDKAGDCIYSIKDTLLFNEDTPVPQLEIESLRDKVQLSIQVAAEVKLEVESLIPAGRPRVPEFGELVITEFFTAPQASDSTQYEFIELYNGTLDTLSLKNCSYGKSSKESDGVWVKDIQAAPKSFVVLGDISSKAPDSFKNTEKWIPLTNDKGNIVIQCNGILIDSLYYGKPDSIHVQTIPVAGTTNSNARSSQLNIEKWAQRADSASWTIKAPTPGAL